jgi:hypothetical protein
MGAITHEQVAIAHRSLEDGGAVDDGNGIMAAEYTEVSNFPIVEVTSRTLKKPFSLILNSVPYIITTHTLFLILPITSSQ